MGMFDTFTIEEDPLLGEIDVQTKKFDCVLEHFRVGDLVTWDSYGVEVVREKTNIFSSGGVNYYGSKDKSVNTRDVFIVLYSGICVEAYSRVGDLDESDIDAEVLALQYKWLNRSHEVTTIAKHSLFEYSKRNSELNATLNRIQNLIDGYDKKDQLMDDPRWVDNIAYFSTLQYLKEGYTLGEAINDEINKCKLENTGVD